MNNKRLLIGCLLALIALACGSGGPANAPVEQLAPVERLATLTPTLAAADTVPVVTESPPTETLTPVPATDTPAPESTSTEIPATETPLPDPPEPVEGPTVAPEAPTPVPPTLAPAATAAPDCECSFDAYNCGDGQIAKTCFEYCRSAGAGDIHRLDQDDDGLACEGN